MEQIFVEKKRKREVEREWWDCCTTYYFFTWNNFWNYLSGVDESAKWGIASFYSMMILFPCKLYFDQQLSVALHTTHRQDVLNLNQLLFLVFIVAERYCNSTMLDKQSSLSPSPYFCVFFFYRKRKECNCYNEYY